MSEIKVKERRKTNNSKHLTEENKYYVDVKSRNFESPSKNLRNKQIEGKSNEVYVPKNKVRRLIPEKKETLSLNTEISPYRNVGGKISSYLIQNYEHNEEQMKTPIKNLNTSRKLNEDINGSLIHDISKTNYFNSNQKINTIHNRNRSDITMLNSPYNIKIPGKESKNGTITNINLNLKNFGNTTSFGDSNTNRFVSPKATSRNPNYSETFRTSNQKFSSRKLYTNQDNVQTEESDIYQSKKNVLHTVDGNRIGFSPREKNSDSSLFSIKFDPQSQKSSKGGRIDFNYKSPNTKSRECLVLYSNRTNRNKIIYIQSFFRGYSFRTKLYNILFRYYTGIAFINRIKQFKAKYTKRVLPNFFNNLKYLAKKKNKKKNEIKVNDKNTKSKTKIESPKKNPLKKLITFNNEFEEEILNVSPSFKKREPENYDIRQVENFDLFKLNNDYDVDSISKEIKDKIISEYILNKIRNFEKCNSINYSFNPFCQKEKEFSNLIENFNFFIEDIQRRSVNNHKKYFNNIIDKQFDNELCYTSKKFSSFDEIEIDYLTSKIDLAKDIEEVNQYYQKRLIELKLFIKDNKPNEIDKQFNNDLSFHSKKFTSFSEVGIDYQTSKLELSKNLDYLLPYYEKRFVEFKLLAQNKKQNIFDTQFVNEFKFNSKKFSSFDEIEIDYLTSKVDLAKNLEELHQYYEKRMVELRLFVKDNKPNVIDKQFNNELSFNSKKFSSFSKLEIECYTSKFELWKNLEELNHYYEKRFEELNIYNKERKQNVIEGNLINFEIYKTKRDKDISENSKPIKIETSTSNKDDPVKKKLNEALNKRLKQKEDKQPISNYKIPTENNRNTYTKSSKIMGLAKLLENQLFGVSEEDKNIPTSSDDNYMRVIGEKIIVNNKKKPKKAMMKFCI